jgi:hypothetical protein
MVFFIPETSPHPTEYRESLDDPIHQAANPREGKAPF